MQPGDRVQIVGLFRAMPNKFQGGTNGVFRYIFGASPYFAHVCSTVIIANHVHVLSKEATLPQFGGLLAAALDNASLIACRARHQELPRHLAHEVPRL